MNEIINEVEKVVSWYKELPKDYSNISDIMYARKKITTYQFYMSVELGKLRKVWKEFEVRREIVRRSKAVELIDEGLAMTKVQEMSKYEALDMFNEEKLADIEYHNMRFMVDSTQEVSNSMMMHLSQLKIEQKNVTLQT
jgi:hypothetical protein